VPPDGLPLPTPELHFLVSGNRNLDASSFWQIGSGCAAMMVALLKKHAVPMDDLDAILDFGCGCGRMIRHFHSLQKTRVYGTDYNLELIDWCRRNLPFAEFGANQLHPPLAYDDAKFDFIYTFSVFTHLPERLQLPWLEELSRVLKPGGHLLMTTHGAACAHAYLTAQDSDRFASGRLVVVSEELAGTNECIVYHPVDYVTRTFSRGLEVLEVIPAAGPVGGQGWIGQDIYLFKKPRPTTGSRESM
jgi:SAM-dependent methyltransferase